MRTFHTLSGLIKNLSVSNEISSITKDMMSAFYIAPLIIYCVCVCTILERGFNTILYTVHCTVQQWSWLFFRCIFVLQSWIRIRNAFKINNKLKNINKYLPMYVCMYVCMRKYLSLCECVCVKYVIRNRIKQRLY